MKKGIFRTPTKNRSFKKKDSIKDYKNFQLVNDRELIFKNGSGKMILNDQISDYSVIEKDGEIYLVGY